MEFTLNVAPSALSSDWPKMGLGWDVVANASLVSSVASSGNWEPDCPKFPLDATEMRSAQ